jgi:hypothetical protein
MFYKNTQCKIFALYCVILLSSVYGKSYGQKFSMGLRGGALVSWAHFGEKEERAKFGSRMKLGYTAGGLINFPLKNRWEFQTEGAYSKKGRVIKSQENTWTNTATYNMIDLSMCLRKSFTFYIKDDLPVDWFFNVGPEISYIINGKGFIKVGGPRYEYDIIFNPKDSTNDYHHMSYFNANKWLFGLGVGVGFKFPIRPGQHLVTELRFVSGHTYLGKKGTGLPTTNPDQGYSYINILTYEDTLKTNIKAFSITVAYVFDFDIQKGRMGKSTLDKKIKRKKR